jgi:DNA-binding HxlR family transcriptional regulator
MTPKATTRQGRRSSCPIASALDYVGDKWTLLLIRDVGLFNKHRHKDFQEGPESIPSNLLADRLKRLVEHGLLEKRKYQDHPPRFEYHLTEPGRALIPIVKAMATWSLRHVEGVDMPRRPKR